VIRLLVLVAFLAAGCSAEPAHIKCALPGSKVFKLKVGESYNLKIRGGEWTTGEYLGSRTIFGRNYLVIRAVMAQCKGEDGCWQRRNIALAEVVEITPETDDRQCLRHWCTD